MSVTGHGPRLGGPEDVYETPTWCVRRLLDAWRPRAGVRLEPSAGSGKIITAATDAGDPGPWWAVEKRKEIDLDLWTTPVEMVWLGDLMQPLGEIERRAAEVVAVVGNPPYRHALAHLLRIFGLFPGADVAMLLRLDFLASAKRGAIFRRRTPDVLVLPDRPSFTGGQTDSADYAWFVWPAGRTDHAPGTVRILASTPIAERKQG